MDANLFFNLGYISLDNISFARDVQLSNKKNYKSVMRTTHNEGHLCYFVLTVS